MAGRMVACGRSSAIAGRPGRTRRELSPAAHHGRVVKRTGDSSLIEFRSAVDAVRWAIEVQNDVDNRLELAFVRLALVGDPADIDGVRQDLLDVTSTEQAADHAPPKWAAQRSRENTMEIIAGLSDDKQSDSQPWPSDQPAEAGKSQRPSRSATLCRYRFPPEIIDQAIWLYLRFTLSLRDVEGLVADRGLACIVTSGKKRFPRRILPTC